MWNQKPLFLVESAAALFFLIATTAVLSAPDERPPNFVIIFADDQGYQDLGCFGSQVIRTPNIDRMAREGVKFTDFYVAAPLCTPSRAALMTGCYPRRVGLAAGVLRPNAVRGLNPDEVTLPEPQSRRVRSEALRRHGRAARRERSGRGTASESR